MSVSRNVELGHDRPSKILHRVKADAQAAEIRHLSKPFWATLLIGAFSLLALVVLLARSLDSNAIAASEQIFSSMQADRVERLEDIALEYGYWDTAVDNLTGEVNMSWVEETFVDYLQAELQIDALHVLDGADRPILHVIDDAVSLADPAVRYGAGLDGLIARARATEKDKTPRPASGLVGNLDTLHLVSAVQMTSYDADADFSTDHVLVFAQTVDGDTLSQLAERYRLPKLRLSERGPGFFEAGSLISLSDGSRLGYFVWAPDLPGLKLLPYLLAGLLLVYGLMFFSARLFLHRASGVVRQLAEANSRAEQAREHLAVQVRLDPLTGLGNRRSLDEKLAELYAMGEGNGHALLYLDLDRFKEINDTHGHETGDEVLQYVARALLTVSDTADTVLRVGGDEFVIIFGMPDRKRVLHTGHQIIEILHRPVTLRDVDFRFGASIGLAFSDNPSELLRQADVALYSAKRQGRGQLAIYSSKLLDPGKAALNP